MCPQLTRNLASSVLISLLIQQTAGRDMAKGESELFSGQAADRGVGENISKTQMLF